MNERITQLAKQAEKLADEATNAYTDDSGNWQKVWNDVYDEKFAELIVRECYNISLKSGHPISELKKHFGVE